MWFQNLPLEDSEDGIVETEEQKQLEAILSQHTERTKSFAGKQSCVTGRAVTKLWSFDRSDDNKAERK